MTNSSQVSMYEDRQIRLLAILQSSGLEALVLNPGPSMAYLTGLNFHLMERPVVVIIRPATPLALILPGLEVGKTRTLPYPIQIFPYSDNPVTWPDAFQKAVQATGLNGCRVGVEVTRFRFLEFQYLQAAAPQAQFTHDQGCLAAIRIQKDKNEIAAMRKAVDIAQEALQATLPLVKIGMTETELAGGLTLQLLRAGSQPEMPFAPIVASGPNSANPHSIPSERKLASGDLLILDWGATYQGYISDLTRTFVVGQPNPELERIAQIVQDANTAGRKTARPGIPAGDIDRAARSVIDQAGLGEFFIHRTGHGIGLEAHEDPYIYAENTLLLAPGMTFTVEPGIYLPDRGGVRIEDNVLITEQGSESLSDLPRELIVLAN